MHSTREQWLNHLAQLLQPHFARAGFPLPPNIRFSCGWPGAGDRRTREGECWHTSASADRSFEIFVSPSVSDPLHVADILIHELCHAAVGVDAGHGSLFRRCALAVGLAGKMRSTVLSPALQERHTALLADSGPYPTRNSTQRIAPPRKTAPGSS